ncbi:hypothetical protein [Bradyrhizobium sp. Ai1a-2]|uniref:hypothetical protein n=1 Tax=Bradyrhizobium sp. Ai1a-2 TaxID=196490 RepID=UPI000480FEF3|nr:hypothetical protein [Bradyrhizobium sp. Ai1a-2]
MTLPTAPAAPIEPIGVYAKERIFGRSSGGGLAGSVRNLLNRGLAVTDKRGAAWQESRKIECKWLIKVSLS